MTVSHSRVLIAGGGIGGLCLAQGLRKAGIDCAVYERDSASASRRQGYRIHIDPTGSRALQACLTEAVFEKFLATNSRPATRPPLFLDAAGRPLAPPANAPAPVVPADPVHHHRAADRQLFRQVLTTGLDTSLHFGKGAAGYKIGSSDTVTLLLDDGSSVSGDLLVGADGVHSKVRRQLLPDAVLAETNARCLYGKTPVTPDLRDRMDALLTSAFTIVRGPDRRSLFIGGFLQPCAVSEPDDDYLMWVFVAPKDQFAGIEGEVPPGDPRLRDAVLKYIEGWDPLLVEMVAASDTTSCTLITIRESAPVAPWPSGRVTLLGDAIHTMSPAGGVGANTALRDAARLTHHLTTALQSGQSLVDGVRAYELEMLAYGFDAVRQSQQMARVLFGDFG